jgi:hypothetical protein
MSDRTTDELATVVAAARISDRVRRIAIEAIKDHLQKHYRFSRRRGNAAFSETLGRWVTESEANAELMAALARVEAATG